eukprot:g5933.t1
MGLLVPVASAAVLCGCSEGRSVAIPRFAADFRNGSELQAGIDAAVAAGVSSYTLPAGDFLFGAAAAAHGVVGGVSLLISGAKHMCISGAGPGSTSLWFVPGHGIDLEGCANVTLRGFDTDTVTPAFSQGTLVSLDASRSTATYAVEPGFPRADDPFLFNQTCADGSPGYCGEVKAVFWSSTTRRMLQGQQMTNPMQNVTCDGGGSAGGAGAGATCTVALPALDAGWASSPPPPGTLLTLSPRLHASKWPIPSFYRGAFGVYNCTAMLFEDIDTHGAGDMVWVEHLGGGANTYRRVRVVRRPAARQPGRGYGYGYGHGPGYGSRYGPGYGGAARGGYAPRLLAANLDTFHSMSCARGPTVEDCEFSFVGDDYLNVHNRLLPLARLDLDPSGSLATAWILDVGTAPLHGYTGATQGGARNAHVAHTMDVVAAGAVIELFAAAPPYEPLGAVVALAAPAAVSNATAALPPLPPLLAKRAEPGAFVAYAVRFDTAAATALAPQLLNGSAGVFGALAQVAGLSSAGATVRRTHFHDSYNNVARIAASHVLYRDNTVERNGDGIHISDDIASFAFLEGALGRKNISFVNNSFLGVRGCGAARSGARSCGHVCSNVSCVFSHVDAVYAPQLHERANSAGFGDSLLRIL